MAARAFPRSLTSTRVASAIAITSDTRAAGVGCTHTHIAMNQRTERVMGAHQPANRLQLFMSRYFAYRIRLFILFC